MVEEGIELRRGFSVKLGDEGSGVGDDLDCVGENDLEAVSLGGEGEDSWGTYPSECVARGGVLVALEPLLETRGIDGIDPLLP